MNAGAAETDTQAENVANTSGITISTLRKTLEEKLNAEHVDIEDMSGNLFDWIQNCVRLILLGGCGQAFNATIVSSQFENKNSLARHRLVNSTLKAEIAAIHAWTPKCITPQEWRMKQGVGGVEDSKA